MPTRRPERIRRDALVLAIQKGGEGCVDCASRYFALARQHGATEEEINAAISRFDGPSSVGISRRRLLEIALASAAGIALGSLPTQPRPAEAYSFWWGTDTGTVRQTGAPPQNFYIGRTGGGLSSNSTYFNVGAARLAGSQQTYMYWDVEGPSGKSDPYQWGVNQANAAADNWISGPDWVYIGGTTIFGDVEATNTGYSGTTQAQNQQVLKGWLDTIYGHGFSNGIYVSMKDWKTLLGTGYRPDHNFAFWVTGCRTGYDTGNPCTEPATAESNAVNLVNSTISNEIVGGSKMVIWQYWTSGEGCGDYDVTIDDPSGSFGSINSTTTWQCQSCGNFSPCP